MGKEGVALVHTCQCAGCAIGRDALLTLNVRLRLTCAVVDRTKKELTLGSYVVHYATC